ncbi:MAG TPA: DNA polymerase IV [Gemmatimonadales bacterium]|nr:DNA polymerase IV [Gemmatimonadales bacterium]
MDTPSPPPAVPPAVPPAAPAAPAAPAGPARRILYADADSMFVHAARLVGDPPGVATAELLIVGGRAESRGVVTSASYAARAYGVRAGMPIAQAARLCPRAMFVPVPREMVGRKSREMAEVLRRWAPVVSARSVDEFALDLSGTEGVYRGEPLAETARRIRADVLARTGMPMSIGGGTNVLVAKLAVDLAKPRAGGPTPGVHVVAPGEEAAFLATLELAAIPGIGPKFQARLRQVGLTTVRQALRYDRAALVAMFGEGTGEWLHDRLRGIDPTPVTDGPEAPKQVSREETFPRDLVEAADLERELLRLAMRVSADLRADGLEARTVTVRLRDHDFTTRQAGRTLAETITSDRAVFLVARELLAKLRADRWAPARLLGITLSGFEAPAAVQLALFDEAADAPPVETARDRTLASVLDTIAARHGRRAIVRGTLIEPTDDSDSEPSA